MPNFLNLCRTGVHCATCRTDEAWRVQVAKHYDMPSGWPRCPYGKPMDGEQPETAPRTYPRNRERPKLEPGLTREMYEQMRRDGLVN